MLSQVTIDPSDVAAVNAPACQSSSDGQLHPLQVISLTYDCNGNVGGIRENEFALWKASAQTPILDDWHPVSTLRCLASIRKEEYYHPAPESPKP